MEDEKILACPWCGGEAKSGLFTYGHGGGRSGVGPTDQYGVICLCGARGTLKHERPAAISAWNSVASLKKDRDAMAGRVRKLDAILRELLLSGDASWTHRGGGHDWEEAAEEARRALEGVKP